MLRIALQGSIPRAAKITELVRKNENCLVSGICSGLNDTDPELDKQTDHPVQVFSSVSSVLNHSDAVIFLEHGDDSVPYVKECLKNSKHVFINPAVSLKPAILEEYSKLADEADVILYLFHKPQLAELKDILENMPSAPEFIDLYRYVIHKQEDTRQETIAAIFQEVLFLQSLNQFPIKRFKVATVPYCSDKPFIINLRIDFTNGTTANLTINTFTGLEARFSELYYSDSLVQVNTLEEKIQQRFWNSKENIKHRLKSGIKSEQDPSSDIEEFLRQISSFSLPVNNYQYGHHIYITFWNILKEISPVNSYTRD